MKENIKFTVDGKWSDRGYLPLIEVKAGEIHSVHHDTAVIIVDSGKGERTNEPTTAETKAGAKPAQEESDDTKSNDADAGDSTSESDNSSDESGTDSDADAGINESTETKDETPSETDSDDTTTAEKPKKPRGRPKKDKPAVADKAAAETA